MKLLRSKMYRYVFIGTILIFMFSCFCGKDQKQHNKIRVVVSIPPLAEFAEKIGGDNISVVSMVPLNASAHTYEPTPDQMIQVSHAKMYVKVGTPIEFELVWLEKIIAMNKKMHIVNAAKGIDALEYNHQMHDNNEHHEEKHIHEHNSDPHAWLSPLNAKTMVENIYAGLATIDPQHESFYAANKNRYLSALDSLHQEITAKVQGATNRKFMVYHPAWSYFAACYQLEQIAVEQEGKSPTAKGIHNSIIQAKQYHIDKIIASPQFNINSAELIAKEINGKIVLINPLAKDYIENMRLLAGLF